MFTKFMKMLCRYASMQIEIPRPPIPVGWRGDRRVGMRASITCAKVITSLRSVFINKNI